MVPELARDQNFTLASRKPIEEYEEAKTLGYQTRPVLVGPVTFLKLAKSKNAGFEPLSLLDRLLPVYIDVLRELADRGAEWVQIDEPCLVLDLDSAALQALRHAYAEIARAVPQIKIMLASYFGALGDSRDTAFALPVAGLHLDLVRAPGQIDDIASLPDDRVLSLGVIDGRNVWRADLEPGSRSPRRPSSPASAGERVQIAPSCSLLHVPIDLALETVARFRDQALAGVRAAEARRTAPRWAPRLPRPCAPRVACSTAADAGGRAARSTSPRIHNPAVAGARCARIDDAMRPPRQRLCRARARCSSALQAAALPDHDHRLVPADRATSAHARAAHARGALGEADYKTYHAGARSRAAVALQEDIGLDVLVHGEFERNDMVEYFGEQLDGFAFTENGWVQSYGSRCVKPPILFGDVSRPQPMTVELDGGMRSR